MSASWPMVKLGKVVDDLTNIRSFTVKSDDEIIDPTISSARHRISVAAKSQGYEVKVTKRVRIEPGDLVFSRLHTQNGAFAYSNGVFHATNTFVPLSPHEDNVDRQFLYWALHRCVPSLSSSDSVGRETYKTADILNLEIPLPPLVEQQRIVARIEALVEQIQEAQRLRKEVIGQTDVLGGMSAKAGFCGNWPRTRLEDVCEIITDGTHQTPQYVETDGYTFLSAQNIKPFRFMPENHRKVSYEDYIGCQKRVKPQKGDVLLTRVGAGIGEAAVIDRDIDFAFYVSLALIRPNQEKLVPELLAHWLNSPEGVEQSRGQTLGKGHSQGNLNLKLLRGFDLPLPPLPEQRRIVAELDALQAQMDTLKRIQLETTAELDALLPAILDKAFRGELS